MNLRVLRPVVGLWLCACLTVLAAESRRGGGSGGANKPKQNSPCLDVPAHQLGVILCRPTSNSVTASVLAYADVFAYDNISFENCPFTDNSAFINKTMRPDYNAFLYHSPFFDNRCRVNLFHFCILYFDFNVL